MFAVESLTSEDDLQRELMRFVEGACTCSCVLYELENGENQLRERDGRADGLNNAHTMLWGCACLGGSLERGKNVTCKDQLQSDGQVLHRLALTCH